MGVFKGTGIGICVTGTDHFMYNYQKRILMDTFRIRTTVSKDGKLSIKGLPFRPGARVEVVVRAETKRPSPAKRKELAGELQALFKQIQSLPQAKTITEEEIAVEIAAYRASKTK